MIWKEILEFRLYLGDHSSRIQMPELMWGEEESASVLGEGPWNLNSKTRKRYSWFMRIVRNKSYGQSPVGMIKTINPLPSQLGRIGRFILHQPSQWKKTRISWLHHQHSMRRSGNCLSYIWGSYSCATHAIKEDQEGVAQEEQDIIDRYYFSSYGRNDLNLIR